MSDTDQGYGQQDPSSSSSDFNTVSFIIQQALASISTMKLVKIVKVTNDGGVAAVGFVDVQPLVQLLDGNNVATDHGTIHNVPYTRIQGGNCAIIMDPKVNDIGWCAISDRDISSVKENKAVSTPGSLRKFDLADAVYIGGILNGVPENYVQFTGDDKINILAKSDISATTQGDLNATVQGKVNVVAQSDIVLNSATKIELIAPIIKLTGGIQFNGTATGTSGTINIGSPVVSTANISTSASINGGSVNQGSINLLSHHHTGPVVAGAVTTGGALP